MEQPKKTPTDQSGTFKKKNKTEFKKAFHHLANEEKEKAIRLAILLCQSSKKVQKNLCGYDISSKYKHAIE
ncbi:hypothetical protein ABE402_03550 [Bacillus smithii]|uniref:hypothetical protein n=1 Tax=Bacillus smithii TaxID=1479 RepID=UPI003D242EC6